MFAPSARRALVVFAALSAPLGGGVAQAADDLYAPAPPAGSAFVRVVHAQPDGPAVEAKVGGKSAGKVAYAQAGAYVVVPQGERVAEFAGKGQTTFTVAAGGFYTAALTPGGVVILTDGSNTNLAKALLSIYNLTDAPSLELKTADLATTVVTGVAPGAVGSRAVNPLTVGFAAAMGDRVLCQQAPTALARGAAYSLVVTGSLERPTCTWVQSTTQAP